MLTCPIMKRAHTDPSLRQRLWRTRVWISTIESDGHLFNGPIGLAKPVGINYYRLTLHALESVSVNDGVEDR